MFDRRTLIAQHQSIIQEALDQIKSMKAALKAGKITSSVSVYQVSLNLSHAALCDALQSDDNLWAVLQDIANQMGSAVMKAQKSLKKAKGDTSVSNRKMCSWEMCHHAVQCVLACCRADVVGHMFI